MSSRISPTTQPSSFVYAFYQPLLNSSSNMFSISLNFDSSILKQPIVSAVLQVHACQFYALQNMTTHTFQGIAPTTHPASFLYTFYCVSIFKNPQTQILITQNHANRLQLACGVLQQQNNLKLLKSCTQHISCFNYTHNLLASCENPSNVL